MRRRSHGNRNRNSHNDDFSKYVRFPKILELPNGDEELVEVIYPTDGIRFRYTGPQYTLTGGSGWYIKGAGLYFRDLPEEEDTNAQIA